MSSVSSEEKVTSEFILSSDSKSLAPMWSCCRRPHWFWVLNGSFGGKEGIRAEDVALFTATCERDSVDGGGPARFNWSVTVVPRHFLPMTPLTCDQIPQAVFQFEPKVPFLLCPTPASMGVTHSKPISFLKSRLWQL